MKAYFYYNKSDKRYVKKEIEFIPPYVSSGPTPDHIDVEFIESSSIINPRLVMSPRSECLKANYLFLEDFGRYYYIDDFTVDRSRIIIDCSVDVLMSFWSQIKEKDVIINRITAAEFNNFYLQDEKLKQLSYPFIEAHELECVSGDAFDKDKNYFILAVAGAVAGDEPEPEENEGGGE